MGTMPPMIEPAFPGLGNLRLPSVQDVLRGVHLSQEVPVRPAPQAALCQTCLSRDRKTALVAGESCAYCASDSLGLPQPHLERRHSNSNLHAFPRSPYQPLDSSSRRPSLPSLHENRLATNHYQRLSPSPLTQSPLPSPRPSGHPLNLYHPSYHASLPLTLPTSNSRPMPSNEPSAAKMASKARHKLSEKQRRDGGSSFVNAAHLLISGISPGVELNCSICIADPKENPCITTSGNGAEVMPSSSFDTSMQMNPAQSSVTDPPNKSGGGNTKNEMLQMAFEWKFMVLLHIAPDRVPGQLQVIRDHAAQLARDKEAGLRASGNDEKKRKKWDADVRASTIWECLGNLEELCERHGVDAWGAAAGVESSNGQKKRKRVVEDVATPPSSRGSPGCGWAERETSESESG